MEHENCWEFWACPQGIRDDCPAFLTFNGKDCFDFAENYCPKIDSGFRNCYECPWYNKIKPEINREEKAKSKKY